MWEATDYGTRQRVSVLSLFLCPTLCDPIDCSCQAPLSMRFSRQEYWSGFPCPPPGDLPDPGIELESFMSPALVGVFFTTSATWEVLKGRVGHIYSH